MRSLIRNHPIRMATGAVVVVAGLAWLAFGFFGVHTLFIDDVVDESGPVFDATPVALETADASTSTSAPDTTRSATATDATAAPNDGTVAEAVTASTVAPTDRRIPAASTTETTTPAAPQVVTEYGGVFAGDAHPTAGTAIVLGNGTGQRFLRFEDFETDNGPDLNVYLVNSSTGDVSDYIDLGDLKGNIGDQNYEIPADVDLDVYDEVVIWCVRFSVGFGNALLTPA
jgi:hypothetical protein